MSMHPYSSSLLREMEMASEADRKLAAQRRLLLGDAPPPSQPGAIHSLVSAAMARLSERWSNRSRTPRARQTMEPSGS